MADIQNTRNSARAAPVRRGAPRPDFGMLLRALRYVGRHRRLAVLAYGSLLVATAAQLVVPQLVRVIIDSFVGGAQPAAGQSGAVQTLLGAMVAIVLFSVVRALF